MSDSIIPPSLNNGNHTETFEYNHTRNPNIPGGQVLHDEIVISGIAARLPNSDNLEEFKENLFNGIDMVTVNDRWPKGIHGIPERSGLIKDLSKFDASFFGVHHKQAENMDPQIRMFLELTFECIVDAGVNPNTLRGKKVGVFMGSSNSETEEILSMDTENSSGYVLSGCQRGMFGNRISFAFDFKGPSNTIDTVCSSSISALDEAVIRLRTGKCESAIVGGSNVLLKPDRSHQFNQLNMLSPDGRCKAFNETVNGYVRSDAVVCLFLQRSSVAKRNYARILHSGTSNDGYKEEGITFPSVTEQKKLLSDIYDEAEIDPCNISYFEAHGTGTPVGDSAEINAVTEIFCKNRSEPLKIGSVKTNMGHSEAASGLCGIAKIIIAIEEGNIPPNLHYSNPNPSIPGLADGRLQVVTKATKWKPGIVGLSSYGFGGSNAHVVLKANQKNKKIFPAFGKSVLVPVSGRTEEAVAAILDKVDSHYEDVEFNALLHGLFKENIPGHNYRGYTVVHEGKKFRHIEKFEDNKPPIYFICSGMGSQYLEMGKSLQQFKVFHDSIKRSAKVLKPFGIDLYKNIMEESSRSLENMEAIFTFIVSIQVALVDLLSSIGIYPDAIIGHSIGETVAAYADGAITAEQCVFSAYWRGRIVREIIPADGAMASVGLGIVDAEQLLPEDIEIACHNSADNVTISGPSKSICKVVEQLKGRDVFAKEVQASGYAFHSRTMLEVTPTLKVILEKIIPDPKARSSRWISTSIPESKWNTPLSLTASADYFNNNLQSRVLFYDALKKIPENAVVLEIAPHCILQAILKRSLPSCTNIGLLKRGCNPAEFFLQALGKLFVAGYNFDISALYPTVKFPVSRGTPMIAPLIKWDHSASWTVADYHKYMESKSECNTVEINVNDEKDKFYLGHVIDGRVLFPAAGYLYLVWKIFASKLKKNPNDLPVVFNNINYLLPVIFPKTGTTKFVINILPGDGKFQLSENGSVVVTGNISVPEDNGGSNEFPAMSDPSSGNSEFILRSDDVYKEFRLRGYEYKDMFKSIAETDNKGTSGKLKWMNNWITFIDSMLQFQVIASEHRDLYLPTRISKLEIYPQEHTDLPNNTQVLVSINKFTNTIRSGGVVIRSLKTTLVARNHAQTEPLIEEYKFVSYMSTVVEDQMDILRILVNIIAENFRTYQLKVLELFDQNSIDNDIGKVITDIVQEHPLLKIDCISKSLGSTLNNTIQKRNMINNCNGTSYHLIFVTGGYTNSHTFKDVVNNVKDGSFILFKTALNSTLPWFEEVDLQLISSRTTEQFKFLLFRKKSNFSSYKVIKVSYRSYEWVKEVREAITAQNQTILLVSQEESVNGIIGLTNCLRQEDANNIIRSVLITDKSFPKFGLEEKVFQEQMKKDLMVNVLQNGVWGSYRHLPLASGKCPKQTYVEHAYVDILIQGDLSSLTWIESSLKVYSPVKQHDLNTCQVYYAPLNFRDIMVSSGRLPVEPFAGTSTILNSVLGWEFIGKDSTGKRVMGIVPGRGLATTVVPDRDFFWDIPDTWTMKNAASVPLVYATAYYALVLRGQIRKGDTILIHSGSGGVGQAAIAIALHLGCTVYTTVSSNVKREFLKNKFPQLNDTSFANSRDCSFEDHIMTVTKGRGVDVVLNSLSDEKLQASIQCLAHHGKFLEIGKSDMTTNSSIGMSAFLKNISFTAILLDSLFYADKNEKKELVKLVSNGIAAGVVKPLPVKIYSDSQVEEAFRFMASGKHIGKVVIQLRDEEGASITKTIQAIPKTYFYSSKVYILVGGLGGFGLELANWMVTRGARNIVLVSRSGVKDGYQAYCLRRWRDNGVTVTVSKDDITSVEGTRRILEQSGKYGAVGGIFNLTLVLRDAPATTQTPENFELVCAPKVQGTLNLDFASRQLCPDLDHFVVFSSSVSGLGNINQSNYGFANSVMERICEERQSQGYPGLAIQWGAIGDVGFVHDKLNGNDTVICGTMPQRINSCLDTLDYFLQQSSPIVSSLVKSRKYDAKAVSETSCLKKNLVNSVAHILGVKDVSRVDVNHSLANLGLDSLMGIELKQVLDRDFEINLNINEIRKLTFAKLFKMSESISTLL